MGPGDLAQVLSKLPKFNNDKVLVGLDTSDDGAIYKLDDNTAIIQTLDFFTPIVDDPYSFGEIAAANAISDIYAMGGEVIMAMNIVAFPDFLEPEILEEILKGGANKIMEAGGVLVGGHTIKDDVPKYGLSVTGLVHPDKIFTNRGAKAGDVLILTKRIGTGIINTAIKRKVASEENVKEVENSMKALNKKAKEVMENFNISSCTDITGFGLLGHMLEMTSESDISFEIDTENIELFNDTIQYAKEGYVPGGAKNNRAYFSDKIDLGSISDEMINILFDPQTSGGLLISIPGDKKDEILAAFREKNMETPVFEIGRVVERKDKDIILL